MPPFRIVPAEIEGEAAVRWTMDLNEAREVAEYLDLVEKTRAHEMAYDLRNGVQLAISNRFGK